MPPALSTSSLYASASPPPAGLSSRNSWTPESRAPSRLARRATSCWRPSRCARSIWCSSCRLDRWGPTAWIFAPVDQLRSGVAGDLPSAQRGGKLTDGPAMIPVTSAFSELERGMIVQRVVAGVKKDTQPASLRPPPADLPPGPAPGVESRLADPGRQSAGNWECRSAPSATPCQKAPLYPPPFPPESAGIRGPYAPLTRTISFSQCELTQLRPTT